MKKSLPFLCLFAFFGLGMAAANYLDRDALPPGAVADRILIEKQARQLTLLTEGKTLREYRIALGREPVGHKTAEGDGRAPEGIYRIDSRNQRSRFHLSLHISYPQPADEKRAAQLGRSPGKDIMIHGLPNGLGWIGRLHRIFDWTAGCIALTNPEIEEVWKTAQDGTVVEIRP
jgi:murein L,D-transpeptidase YafK